MSEPAVANVAESLASPKEKTRYGALRRLAAETRPPLGPLLRLLADDSSRIRREAAHVLAGRRDTPAVVAALIEIFTSAVSELAQEAATEGLLLLAEVSGPALARVLAAGSVDARRRAASVIGDIGNDSLVPALASALSDPDRRVRLAAADSLGRTGSEAAAHVLAEACETVEDFGTLLACLDALAFLRSAPPVEVLLRATKHRTMRRVSLRLMAYSDRVEALPAAIDGLKDSVAANRQAALIGFDHLRHLGLDEHQEERAREILSADDFDLIRKTLLAKDSQMFEAAARLAAWLRAPGPAAEVAVGGSRAHTRAAAISALRSLGKEGTEALLYAADTGTPTERAAALDALGSLAAMDVLPLCRELCSNPHPLVAAAAVRTLAKLGVPEDQDAIMEALERESPPLVQAAAKALKSFARREPAAFVAKCRQRAFGTRDEADRAVVDALRGLEQPEVGSILCDALEAGAPRTRAAALGGLGELADPLNDERLLGALGDEAATVRSAAVKALVDRYSGADDKNALDRALSTALSDVDVVVQESAATGLRTLDPRRAFPRLIGAIGSAPERVALAALESVRALREQGDLADRLAAYEAALARNDPEIGRRAVLGLSAIEDLGATSLLRRALGHESFTVRIEATRAYARHRMASAETLSLRLVEEEDPLIREVLRNALDARKRSAAPAESE